MEDTEKQGDLIIIKRGGGGGDGHHGGAWKIAFADFMTAMMAFFLVMWLINASDEETKKAVASYFNPIELMDNTTNPKGLSNPKYGVKKLPVENPEEENTKLAAPDDDAEASAEGAIFDEQALFEDPLALLSEIAGGISDDVSKTEIAKGEETERSENMALSGGENFKDPFDPSSWQTQFDSKLEGEEKLAEMNIDVGTGENLDEEASSNKSPMTGGFQDFEIKSDEEKKQTDNQKNNQKDNGTGDDKANEMAMEKEKKDLEKSKAENKTEAAMLEGPVDENGFEKAIMELNKQLEKSGESSLAIELSQETNGALITLSERASNGMFKIGSARPTPVLVKVMGEIGKLLGKQSGQLTISGHTDGRQYKSRNYDNWRLSTDRAHMAYYMLIKGGVPKTAFEKIEGHADAKLKKVDDPNASENRRIEVFIRKS